MYFVMLIKLLLIKIIVLIYFLEEENVNDFFVLLNLKVILLYNNLV